MKNVSLSVVYNLLTKLQREHNTPLVSLTQKRGRIKCG